MFYIASEAAITEELSHVYMQAQECMIRIANPEGWGNITTLQRPVHRAGSCNHLPKFPALQYQCSRVLKSTCSSEKASGLSCHRGKNYDSCISFLKTCNKHVCKKKFLYDLKVINFHFSIFSLSP